MGTCMFPHSPKVMREEGNLDLPEYRISITFNRVLSKIALEREEGKDESKRQDKKNNCMDGKICRFDTEMMQDRKRENK